MAKYERRGMFANWREDVEVALLEFVGTFMFLLLGLGGIQTALYTASVQRIAEPASVADPTTLMYVATSMGLSLLITAWMFYRVTGGVFNPNITTALLLVGIMSPFKWMILCFAQIVGAIAACAVLDGLTPGSLLVNTTLGTGISPARGVFLEMFLTAALVLSVLMLAAEKHRTTMMAPIGIGLTLFVGHLFGAPYTGPSMNTARSFGPSVIVGFQGSHWVYWVGPGLGSLLAVAFYGILKQIKYWRLNPGQEEEDHHLSPENPFDRAKRVVGRESRKSAERTESV